jgi:Fe-S cluster assembly protein SufD
MNETSAKKYLNTEIIEAFHRSGFTSAGELRSQAIIHFENLGLPGSKAEEYRFTPITRSLEKNFLPADFVTTAPSSITDPGEFLIPGYACNRIVFVNGQYSEEFSRMISPSHQLIVKPLGVALGEDSEIVDQYLTKLADPSVDAFAALNTALWQSGVFIHVPKNIHVEKPVFILHLHDAAHQAVVSQTRVLAVVEEGSHVNIIEKFNTCGSHPVFNSLVEEIAVHENATLNYHKVQNDSGAFHQVTTTRIHQGNGSRVNTFTVTLDGQLIRNNLGIAIDGERCESHFHGLYLLHKNTLADNHTVVDHLKPNSFSNELYKGVMNDNSRGVFNGKIYVRPHAQKTNAFQSNRNILLSDTSTVNTKPQLEIWADDVKCSHGCTSGQLDEEALFYLQSRGISKQSARAMLLYAFADEVLDPIQDLNLKNYFNTLVSERLQKNL